MRSCREQYEGTDSLSHFLLPRCSYFQSLFTKRGFRHVYSDRGYAASYVYADFFSLLNSISDNDFRTKELVECFEFLQPSPTPNIICPTHMPPSAFASAFPRLLLKHQPDTRNLRLTTRIRLFIPIVRHLTKRVPTEAVVSLNRAIQQSQPAQHQRGRACSTSRRKSICPYSLCP